MKKSILGLAGLFCVLLTTAQELPDVLPHYLTPEEAEMARRMGYETPRGRGIETPPEYDNLRCMAEWEEVQALVIGWEGFPAILKQITAEARQECEVIILSEEPAETEQYLLSNSGGDAFADLENISILETDLNTIWARDYSGRTVYANEVGTPFMVDWIYNRPRPDDDLSPEVVADHLGLELYTTTQSPYDVMGTGGNFMSDGFGTAFSSELILEENEGGATWWGTQYPDQSEADIDNIFNQFMGIDTYIKMETLPYDGIHHIDMHMKLLDEQTILLAEYPEGVADGPQINANIEYVLNNYTTKWGTPFRVVRIPSPPQFGVNEYPDEDGWYLTYTNALFVNNTVLVPTYYTEYDTTALRIYEENLPGYNVVGIDCDTSPNNIISLSGALHCITHEVGADDPLLISHQPLEDTEDTVNDYEVVAYMNHNDGVVDATLYWKTDLGDDYTSASMTSLGNNEWQGFIPAQDVDTRIYYYVEGEAADGKIQTRPMPAPAGYWQFDVVGEVVFVEDHDLGTFQPAFPNPAGAITCVPLTLNASTRGSLHLLDMTGREVHTLHAGSFPAGEQKYFFDASQFAAGAYLLRFETEGEQLTQRIMVK